MFELPYLADAGVQLLTLADCSGCDYLLRTYRNGGRSDAKSKTHVRVHQAKEIHSRTGLDHQGLILFAILSGGDYSKGT